MKTTSRHKRVWQLQEAKNRLSEVIRAAREHGPQTITVRGHDQAVVIAVEEFNKLQQPKKGLWELLRNSPLVGSGIDLERIKDTGKALDLGDE